MQTAVELPAPIQGTLCTLRPLRAEDVAPWSAAFREDPDLGPAWGVERDPDEEELTDRVERSRERARLGGGVELAIADPADDSFAGSVVLHSLDARHEHAEIGFWLLASRRGGGIATEGVALMVDWAFSTLEAHRIEMVTMPALPAIDRVRALARRLGFREEGVLRQRNLERGQRRDALMLAVLKHEWEFPQPAGTRGFRRRKGTYLHFRGR